MFEDKAGTAHSGSPRLLVANSLYRPADGCEDGLSPTGHRHLPDRSGGARCPSPPRPTARFHVECPFHHFKETIRSSSRACGSRSEGHMHTFLGNKSTKYFSTYRSLRRAGTTAATAPTRAPTGSPPSTRTAIGSSRRTAISTTGRGPRRSSAIHPFPKGLKIIAGNQEATRPQSTKVVGWSCFGSAGTEEPRCETAARRTSRS